MNVKNLMLGIAIMIMTIFVGVYGINLAYDNPPDYNQFCPQQPILNEEQCKELNGTWSSYQVEKQPGYSESVPIQQNGYCDIYTSCSNELRNAQEKYFKNLFITALITGIIVIAAGLLIFSLAPVGVGLMGGGIGIFLWGSGRYWSYANNLTKFIISLAGLVILILLSYHFNSKFKKKKSV